MAETDRVDRWRDAMAIGGITLLFLVVRLFRIGELSFWWDEYTSLAWLGAPTLLEFLRQNTTLDPATLPAYYTLEYLWHHYVNASPDSLRYLSVLLALPQAPLMYLLGREIFGRGHGGRMAGLAAALCLALSPIHVFHAQSIRMYVLFTTLALCSALSFIRLMRGASRKWWAFHGLANFLLYWTHPFAPFLVAAEGMALLIGRVSPRRWIPWGVLHAALYVPMALYMAGVSFWSPQSTGAWLQTPGFPQFLGDLLFDDVIAATYQLRVPVEYWAAHAPWMLSMRPAMDALFTVMVITSIALGCLRMGRRDWGALVFLLVWLLLPAATLYLLSILWRPCIFPRYTLYSSFAVYLFAGAAVAALPRPWLRGLAVAGLAAVMGYQAALSMPGAQRTEWRPAAAHVKAAGAEDTPIVLISSIDRDTFAYNYTLGLAPHPRPMAAAEMPEDAAELVARALSLSVDHAWAVIAGDWFGDAPPVEFEAAAQAHGLLYERTPFPGIRTVYVYQLRRSATAAAPHAPPEDAPLPRVVALGDLAIEWMLQGNGEQARAVLDAVLATHLGRQMAYGRLLEALDGEVPVAGACAAVRASIRAGGHLSEGRYAKAIEACREAVAHDPGLLLAWYNLLMALLESGRFEEALPVFEHLLSLDMPDRAVFAMTFQHLITVIRERGDAQAAFEAAQWLRSAEDLEMSGDWDTARHAIGEAIRRDPGYGFAYLFKARMHAEAGQAELARAAVDQAVTLSPGQWGPLAPALEALLVDRELEKARALAAGLDGEARERLETLLNDEETSP
jgi:tetratricopeptide (TPR) repeat protein